MEQDLSRSADGSVLLMWRALHINGKELYQFDENGENLSKIFFDWNKNQELNELFLVDIKTKEEVVGINLMDGSFVIQGEVIKFENDGASYRAIYYGITKQATFASDPFSAAIKGLGGAVIIGYAVGWKYINKKNQAIKVILHLDAKTVKWRFET